MMTELMQLRKQKEELLLEKQHLQAQQQSHTRKSIAQSLPAGSVLLPSSMESIQVALLERARRLATQSDKEQVQQQLKELFLSYEQAMQQTHQQAAPIRPEEAAAPAAPAAPRIDVPIAAASGGSASVSLSGHVSSVDQPWSGASTQTAEATSTTETNSPAVHFLLTPRVKEAGRARRQIDGRNNG